MLEYNHVVKKRVTLLTRLLTVLLIAICLALLVTQVVFAKNIYVISDGDTVLIHTTHETDPQAVLDEAGLALGASDIYTTEPGLGVSEITIRRSQTVIILCGQTTLQMQTYGETVRELLMRAGITGITQEAVSISLDMQTCDGMVLTLAQTETVTETQTSEIPFGTTYCIDPDLSEGQQKVLVAGVAGQLSTTSAATYVNGIAVEREILSQTQLAAPIDAIIAIGPSSAEDPEITAAKAEAAATGRPVILINKIVTPNGEVLSFRDSDTYRATAYHNSDPGCTIWTATGTLCRVGAIAVDPKVIPYGTKMYILSNDGKYIYGVAVAEDCGGSIKGKRIDLYYDSVAECNKFGIRDCTVYFLE